jgi:hypothetical protein
VMVVQLEPEIAQRGNVVHAAAIDHDCVVHFRASRSSLG